MRAGAKPPFVYDSCNWLTLAEPDHPRRRRKAAHVRGPRGHEGPAERTSHQVHPFPPKPSTAAMQFTPLLIARSFRYQDLLQSKALLQKDLIASEEQRLQVSKYFIDLQLKSSQDAEAAEAAKFEQGQRLLT